MMKDSLESHGGQPPPPSLIGESEAFLAVLEQVSLAAPLSKPVLVIGERGSGKELIAARLHFLSERWGQRLVKFNCAAVSDELLESELFGHVAGAYTGAVKPRTGRFELADGGTLFLDELASMSLRLQEKLLRVLEYGEFERMGSSDTRRVDVRIVAAANADLPTLAAAGRFREDLLDRLSFDVITLPPLRERPADVLLLATRFAEGMARELGREYFAGFSAEAERALLQHPWPGNVRELKNVVERAVYKLANARARVTAVTLDPFDSPWRLRGAALPSGVGNGTLPDTSGVAVAQVPASVPGRGATGIAGAPATTTRLPSDFRLATEAYEISLLRAALKQHGGSQKRAAVALNLNYHQLRNLLRKYRLLKGDAADGEADAAPEDPAGRGRASRA